MGNSTDALIQDILNLKNKSTEKEASAKVEAPAKTDILTDTLLKLAEEFEKADDDKEEKKDDKDNKDEKSEKSESEEEESKGENKSASQAEDIVASALAELDNTKSANAQGETEVTNIDYQKLAAAILEKAAVDGTGVYGLDKDMTASPKTDAGAAANAAEAQNNAKTTVENTEDKDMGVKGPVDPMKGNAPQSAGGDEKPLTPGEIKTAMANMSEEDAGMLFKLAQVGYDVTADVLSEQVNERKKMAKVIETAERVKAAQAWKYLQSLGIDPNAIK